MNWTWGKTYPAPGRCWDCRLSSWRKCRVCDRWVCRNHRHGYGNWFRCTRCPAEAMVALLRAYHRQLRAEFRARQAAELKRAFIRRGGQVLPLVRGAALTLAEERATHPPL